MDRYRVTVKLRPSPPDYQAIEWAYVLKADGAAEAEAIIRRRLSRGPYGQAPHADWTIVVERLT
jgi:hypothetical protein